jgi:hypothetical protein
VQEEEASPPLAQREEAALLQEEAPKAPEALMRKGLLALAAIGFVLALPGAASAID